MPEFKIGPVVLGGLFWEAVLALGILALFLVLVWVAHLLLNRVAKRLTRRLRNRLGERLVGAVSGPVLLLILLQGIFLAATAVSVLDPFRSLLSALWSVAVIAFVALVITRSLREVLAWYTRYVVPRGKGPLDRKLVGPLRRFLTLSIYLLAALLILDQLDISITPLIAGLGIGGLAVALALQPTLSNFFAGTYLVSDNVISPGDFIELENGLRGYVTEVGWRSTRLRTPFNNLVVIPNSRLADSILTNYYGPTMEIGVMVEAGVSYESDLAHVERVTLEVAQEVIQELPEAQKDFEPWFGFERFGDSNIDFWVWVQAKDRIGSFKVKTELMKGLHKRFIQEGIEINYPVRKLVFPEGDGARPSPAARAKADGARTTRQRRKTSPPA